MEIKIDEEKGEMVCSKCNGMGICSIINEDSPNKVKLKSICPKCHGHGKLDWIENIVGKEIIVIEPWYPNAGFTRGIIEYKE